MNTWNDRTTLLALVVCICPMSFACGGSDEDDADKADEEASASIGTEGGLVEASAASVEIPAGALEETVEINLQTVDVSDVVLPDGLDLVSETVAFTPHGTSFESAVTIALDFNSDEDSLVFIRLDDEEDDTWETVDGGVFSSESGELDVNSFSIYGIAVALGGAIDMEIDLVATCEKVCADQQSLDCPNEPDQASCEADCAADDVPGPGEACFEEYVAFATCVGEAGAAAFQCGEDGEADLKVEEEGDLCREELILLNPCIQGQ